MWLFLVKILIKYVNSAIAIAIKLISIAITAVMRVMLKK